MARTCTATLSKKHWFCFLTALMLVTCAHVFFGMGNATIDSYKPPEDDFEGVVEHVPDRESPRPKTFSEMVKKLPAFALSIVAHLKTNRVMMHAFLDRVRRGACYRDAMHTMRSILHGEMWAIKMLDAYGKLGEGLLDGNIKWLGSYDECSAIYAPSLNDTVGNFRGQYCTVDIGIELPSQEVQITVGVCVPESCNPVKVKEQYTEDFATTFKDILPFLDFINSPVYIKGVTCQPIVKKWTTEALLMIGSLSIITLLVVIGSSLTVLGYYLEGISNSYTQLINVGKSASDTSNKECLKPKPNNVADLSLHAERLESCLGLSKPWLEFFNCFCCLTNGKKLFCFGASDDHLLCLHGIRFLSFCWIVFIHIFSGSLFVIGNYISATNAMDTPLYQFIVNGQVALDAFIFLGGFLVAHTYFKHCVRNEGNISWVYFYVYRYLRLTPPYVIVMGIYATLQYYIASGPFGSTTEVIPPCRDTWWWNILYINNYLTNRCMPWSWYLAMDMQFYIISPLFLITLWRWPKVGYSVSVLFISITVIINYYLSYEYRLFSGFGNSFPLTESSDVLYNKYSSHFTMVYIKPYTRISPYIVGITVAYILCRRKYAYKKNKLNRLASMAGWFLSLSALLVGIFFWFHRKDDLLLNSAYNAIIHTSNAFALGWIVFACSIEGGVMNSILSCRIFIPFSRMTYSAYLIHQVAVGRYFDALQRPLHYSDATLIILCLGLLAETYFLAALVHLFFEAPSLRLLGFARSK